MDEYYDWSGTWTSLVFAAGVALVIAGFVLWQIRQRSRK